MATRLYAIGPNGQLSTVVEGVGSATSSLLINLTVDLSTTGVTNGSGSRVISREEVLLAIETLEQYLIKSNWPPA